MNRHYYDPAHYWADLNLTNLEPNHTANDQPVTPSADEGATAPVYRPYQDVDKPLRPHRFCTDSKLIGKCPRVLMTPLAYKLMNLYVEIAPKEVGWHGTVTRTKDGDFLIEETFLLEQEVTGTETELDKAGREKLALELLGVGDDAGVEKANRLRFWGHSHVRMGTSPSPTDESTMRQFGREGMPWYVRGIFTKTGRAEFTLYLFDRGIRINDAPWAVWDPVEGIILEGSSHQDYFGSHTYSQTGDYEPTYGFGREWSSPLNKPLPAKLIPDAQLREAVKAEYAAKVRERLPLATLFSWFHKDKDDDNGNAADGECIPTGLDVHSPRTHQTERVTSTRNLRHDTFPQTQPKGRGFLGWIWDLLTGPSANTRTTTPASQTTGQTATELPSQPLPVTDPAGHKPDDKPSPDTR
ncbi:MAG: hypothetical protein HY711_08100 [Candidatus Melainabacteria bacterium]|nr:hypothetical protein [Candidatus Melainabacteria bacterium]